ncbi:hypothetical protein, partial [Streptomyces californicus]
MAEIVNSENSLKGPMREARGSWILIPGRADKRRKTPAESREAAFIKAACGLGFRIRIRSANSWARLAARRDARSDGGAGQVEAEQC